MIISNASWSLKPTGKTDIMATALHMTTSTNWSDGSKPPIFCLRTGHYCGLKKHQKKMGLAETAKCECGFSWTDDRAHSPSLPILRRATLRGLDTWHLASHQTGVERWWPTKLGHTTPRSTPNSEGTSESTTYAGRDGWLRRLRWTANLIWPASSVFDKPCIKSSFDKPCIKLSGRVMMKTGQSGDGRPLFPPVRWPDLCCSARFSDTFPPRVGRLGEHDLSQQDWSQKKKKKIRPARLIAEEEDTIRPARLNAEEKKNLIVFSRISS